MDIEEIKKLIQLIKDTDLAEIEIRKGGESVRICQQFKTQQISPAPVTIPVAPVSVAATSPEPQQAQSPVIQGHVVKSPMVGTIYFAPSEGAQPFVSKGKNIEKGATLCLIEAMKMFNEIESDKSGVIIDILVENGQPVEFGQPLFVIE